MIKWRVLVSLWTVVALVPVRSGAFPAPLSGPHVEFDFNTLGEGRGGNMRLSLTVFTANKELWFTDESNGPRRFNRELLCHLFVSGMKDAGFKAEVVNKSMIRVYGITREGKFYPAVRGEVSSPDLTKEELPKVKNPPRRDG